MLGLGQFSIRLNGYIQNYKNYLGHIYVIIYK